MHFIDDLMLSDWFLQLLIFVSVPSGRDLTSSSWRAELLYDCR